MNYISTRGNQESVASAAAIKMGIAPDGGLFVPETIPQVNESWLKNLLTLDYQEQAQAVLSLFLQDYTAEELAACVTAAYTDAKFDHPAIAPVVSLGAERAVLELWHGPTSAFKDMALQLLPRLLSTALAKTKAREEVLILVATSGDTGKAALEGFKDVPQTKMVVFYPEEGVSDIQRLQMVTQAGNNVAVAAVQGNFDDAQSGVKRIFQDADCAARFAQQNIRLSSANSINWGRLVPQIVYYFTAYAALCRQGTITLGQAVHFVVPTGNFGNILAGYYAKRMGLPIDRLICASNANNVLADALAQGTYNRQRPFYKTASPSMDILISSNWERLLYHMTEGDTAKVKEWMRQLQECGEYALDEACLQAIQAVFWGGWADDDATLATIQRVYEQERYVLDTHTAVAWQVAEQYRAATGDMTPQVIVSTASPFKFSDSVLAGLGAEALPADPFALLKQLADMSGMPVPPALAALQQEPVRHTTVCEKENMLKTVEELLSMLQQDRLSR